MAKSIIAMYGESRLAEAAARDLTARGFPAETIHVEGANDDVRADLTGRNVPDERARAYEEAVRRGATLVIADTGDAEADTAAEVLDAHGSLDVEDMFARLRAQGWAPPPATTGAGVEAPPRGAVGESDVVEEQVRIGVREIERGGVRVRSVVTERPVSETVRLHEERIDVAREPAAEPLSAREAEQAFTEGEVTVTAFGEEPVVEKRAQVVEKVRVAKEEGVREETIEETERRRDVEVEEVEPGEGEPPRRPRAG